MTSPDYFRNHDRRLKFPWSLYHRPIQNRLVRMMNARTSRITVLVVGCGLEPFVAGVPSATFFACDTDQRAIDHCKKQFPEMRERLAACPDPYLLPTDKGFPRSFDVVLAKEVVEHLDEPARWAQELSERVAPSGELILTTPNYGWDSTLGLLERTLLELIARRDGYSRHDIHPSKFNRARLKALDVGSHMHLCEVQTVPSRWTLIGRWHRNEGTT